MADLQNEIGHPVQGDIASLDRLTLVLRKLARFAEIVESVNAYFARFPDSVTPNRAVFERRAEATAVLAGERKAPRQPAPKPRVRLTGIVPEEELVALRPAQGRHCGCTIRTIRLNMRSKD